MEEKKIVGLDGTVYMQDLDGQGWHPLEMPLSSDEIAVQQFQEACVNLREAVIEALGPVAECAKNMAASVCTLVTAWTENLVFLRAYAWAKQARPEWVRILHRTKKQRTRKKYQDKILRAYLEHKEG